MNLDVGCGIYPKGDVNIDLYPEKTLHRSNATNTIDIHRVPNFIKADIHYLPFQNDTFENVTCIAVLEHKNVNFWNGLSELVRVSKDLVTFKVPHTFDRCFSLFNYNHPTHDKWFNTKWLKRNLKKKGYLCIDIHFELRGFPRIFPLFTLPLDIFVTLRK